MKNNPKLEGSNLIDCIPQTGLCPNRCQECYYNNGFFRTLDEPLLPSKEEVGDKIVRVNSGHDSNIEKNCVLEETAQYEKKFYNTSIPNFDFPAPVVFTCNGKDTDLTTYKSYHKNIMFVRFRVNTWSLWLCDEAVKYYAKISVPVVLTFMRYRLVEHVRIPEDYEFKKSIINSYYCIKKRAYDEVVERYYKFNNVRTCGSYESSFCRDCGNCEELYNKVIERRRHDNNTSR